MRTLFTALAAFIAFPAQAETLIDNANGIAVSQSGELQRFDALLIGNDGKVVRRLSKGEPRPRADRRIDARGKTLLPGLIDSHGHVLGLGFAALQLDLVGTRSIDELKQRLSDYVRDNPGDGWVLGRGWNQEAWPGGAFPTAADLDSVVADRPVWLGRVDGHASVGNSAALKAAGITRSTRTPDGGRIERDSAGNPTGLFIDSAMQLVSQKIAPPSARDYDRALAEAQRILLSNGISATADMGTSIDDWLALRRAGDSRRLHVRTIAYASGVDPLLRIASSGPAPWLYGDRLHLAGAKLYGDGALGSRGAWLKRPYADAPGQSGFPVTAPDDLKAQARKAAGAGFQVAIHAIGDRANAEAIAIFESFAAQWPGDRRWRIEHAQILDPADLARLQRSGIIASMQPVHQVSDRTMAEARLGPGRLDGAYAWNSLARSGARLAFGSDFPVESPNPFLGLSAAVSRQDPSGVPTGGWRPEERLTFASALHAFTRGGAYAARAEGRIGSLDPGAWADFIIVDRDVAAVDPQALASTKVLETWISGERRWSADEASTPAR